jgi:hypothetical protein
MCSDLQGVRLPRNVHGLDGITRLVEQLAWGNLMHLLDNRVPYEDMDAEKREATRAEIVAIIDSREQLMMTAEQTIQARDDNDQ